MYTRFEAWEIRKSAQRCSISDACCIDRLIDSISIG